MIKTTSAQQRKRLSEQKRVSNSFRAYRWAIAAGAITILSAAVLAGTLYALRPTPIAIAPIATPAVIPAGLPITIEHLSQIVPEADPNRLAQLLPHLNQAMAEFGINTRLRQAHFIAQIAHESDRFKALEEYASGEDYEGRHDLGNIHPGDGQRFKCRGLIGICGRINYADAGKALNVDLVNNPSQAADLKLVSRIGGWYWHTRQLNPNADKDDIKTITKIINGGFNGLDDRAMLLNRAKKALGCQDISE